jgi:hypothetical protein
MITKVLKNKAGEILTTKETHKELVEREFEVGDEFIPSMNKIFDNVHEVIDSKTKKPKKITNYSIKCSVRSKGKVVTVEGQQEFFVKLTPTQAASLTKKKESSVELNQHIFVVYNYESKLYGTQIGVGLKGQFKPAKKFEDFDNVKFDEGIDYEPIEEE